MRRLGYIWWSDPTVSLPQFFGRIYSHVVTSAADLLLRFPSGQNSGLIVFSRIPFAALPEQFNFRYTDEVLNQKGFVITTLNLPAAGFGGGKATAAETGGSLQPHQQLRVVCTHLDSRYLGSLSLSPSCLSPSFSLS
jgi:hypothetical protein